MDNFQIEIPAKYLTVTRYTRCRWFIDNNNIIWSWPSCLIVSRVQIDRVVSGAAMTESLRAERTVLEFIKFFGILMFIVCDFSRRCQSQEIREKFVYASSKKYTYYWLVCLSWFQMLFRCRICSLTFGYARTFPVFLWSIVLPLSCRCYYCDSWQNHEGRNSRQVPKF